ncbi:MAG: hypothetical protein ACLPYS_14065 [Vulcanimicrobiaceae bacterium]
MPENGQDLTDRILRELAHEPPHHRVELAILAARIDCSGQALAVAEVLNDLVHDKLIESDGNLMGFVAITEAGRHYLAAQDGA